jgi:hypothetical protein
VHRSSEVPVFVEVTPFELTVGTKLTFNKILMETVDDALSSLGKPMKESIYYDLAKFKEHRLKVLGYEKGAQIVY